MNIGSVKLYTDTLAVHGGRIVLIAVLAAVLYLTGKIIIGRAVFPIKAAPKRAQTVRAALTPLLKYTVFFVALAMILQELGINPVSLVAGMGLIGIALGLGAQSLVKDIISGFFILLEGVYSAGDFVMLHLNGAPDAVGLVEDLNLRSTRVQLINGANVAVPNGIIINVTRYPLGYVPLFLNLTLPAELGRKSLKGWLDDLAVDLEHLSKIIVERPRVVEPDVLSDGRIVARLKIHVIPSKESEIGPMIEQIKDHFKERFRTELPEPVASELSEGTLKKYRSVFAPAEIMT
ncbi:MAG: mechanosensitive ion channel domain-containing protein [Actinomycetota bacterium]